MKWLKLLFKEVWQVLLWYCRKVRKTLASHISQHVQRCETYASYLEQFHLSCGWMVQRSLLSVSSAWKYGVTILLGSRHIMASASSRQDQVNLSNSVQGVLCLIISPSSTWRPAPLNHRNIQRLHTLGMHHQLNVKLISTAMHSVPQLLPKMTWIRILLSLSFDAICH